MSKPRQTCDLLLRYLDGTLQSEDRDRVEELLREDAATRLMLRDIAQQAVVIADVERVSRGALVEPTATTDGDNPSRLAAWSRFFLAVAAVALVAVVVSQRLLRRTGEPEIINITALSGPVEWIGDGGRVTEELAIGRKLAGGSIELLSPDSLIEFEFRDHSTVTLTGQSAVTISERRQKELHLRHGRLSASVHPQPAGRPMLVHTPSAELNVLGTQFSVDALSDATRVTVSEGLVRLKRLTDGEEVDVPARHSVTASMEDQNGLPLTERGEAVSVWKSNLKADVVRGRWVSDLWTLGMYLKKAVASGEMEAAEAKVAFKNAATFDNESGSVWATPSRHGAIVVLSATRSSETPIVLSADSQIRIEGRMHSQVSLRFGLTTDRPDGRSGGKHIVSVAPDGLGGDGQKFQIELPLSQFVVGTRSGESPIGKELIDWWCIAESTSAKLEITSVEVIE